MLKEVMLVLIPIISCLVICEAFRIAYNLGWEKGIDDAIYYMNSISGNYLENVNHDVFKLEDIQRIYGGEENDRHKQ